MFLNYFNTVYDLILAAMMYYGMSADPEQPRPAVKGFVVLSFIMVGINVANFILSQ
jgi:hypothetical protein